MASKCQMDFLEKLGKKVLNRKKEHRHPTLHIRNSLGIKFPLKLNFDFLGQINPRRAFPI